MNNIDKYKNFIDSQIPGTREPLVEAKKFIMENGDGDLTIKLIFKNRKWFISDYKYIYTLKSPKSYYRMDVGNSRVPEDTWVIGELVANKEADIEKFSKAVAELRAAKTQSIMMWAFLQDKVAEISPKLKSPDDREPLNPLLQELAERFGKINTKIHFA